MFATGGPPHACMMGHVAAPTTKPIAIRIQRPYESEAELLAAEGATLTRSTLLLLGAKNRDAGTTLRFELVLRSGTPVIRGEGKVLEYQPETAFGYAGLVVKFTRLDARSKKFLEETFGPPSTLAPHSVPPASIAPGSLLPAALAEVDAPFASPSTTNTHVAAHPSDAPPAPAASQAPAAPQAPSTRPNRFSEPVTATHATLLDDVTLPQHAPTPRNTSANGALDRLRQRGRALSQEEREAVLRGWKD